MAANGKLTLRGLLQGSGPSGGRGIVPIALIAVVAVVLGGGGWWLYKSLTTTTITTYFDRTVAIYPGSDVRVLGVQIGAVDSVEPQGNQVKVVLKVDRGVDIPASAKAVQINPSIVGDRYIQLTPVYNGGPKMARSAMIPRDRTATPVEVDQLYKSIKQLSDALGPNGANKNGAVTDLLKTSSANLRGNGDALGTSIANLAKAARYLADARGDIFDTVKNLETFVNTLAVNDEQVRTFNTQLADIAEFLSGERDDLGRALNLLSSSLGDVARFINNNRSLVETNAQGLETLTKVLSDQRDNIAKALPVIPVALSNLINAHNGEAGTLDMRADLPDTQDPLALQCRLLDIGKLKPGDPNFDKLAHEMRPLIDACTSIKDQITNGIKTPLILPLGILSGDNLQRNPVPGTVPGGESNRPPASQTPGGVR